MKYTTEESASLSTSEGISTLLKGYIALSKLRLSSLVVFSAIMGYMTAAPGPWNWYEALLLGLGGLLITASANGFNQIFEREPDKLMSRTCQRPLATGRMSVLEALIFCMSTGVIGLIILGYYFGFIAFLLGLVALLSYAFVYTPMKRISPVSVLIGAFPGAIPPLLGYVAFSGQVSTEAWVLFALQFVWQFPHFWSIAWLLHEDYSKAGFKMLPHSGGQNQKNANTILIYTFMLFPIGLLPLRYEMAGPWALAIIMLSSLYMFICALILYRNCSIKAARHLMFSSFVYLPAVQMALVFNKI